MQELTRQGKHIVIHKNLMYWYNRLRSKGWYCIWCGTGHVAMAKIKEVQLCKN